MLTGSSDKTARLWDAASGEQIHALREHKGSTPCGGTKDPRPAGVRSVAFSPDGERVLTGSSDNTARLWDAASGVPIHALRGHEDSVYSVAFSPDGERLVTGSYDNTARLWRALTRDKLVEFARTRVYRELTQDERRQYGLPLRQ